MEKQEAWETHTSVSSKLRVVRLPLGKAIRKGDGSDVRRDLQRRNGHLFESPPSLKTFREVWVCVTEWAVYFLSSKLECAPVLGASPAGGCLRGKSGGTDTCAVLHRRASCWEAAGGGLGTESPSFLPSELRRAELVQEASASFKAAELRAQVPWDPGLRGRFSTLRIKDLAQSDMTTGCIPEQCDRRAFLLNPRVIGAQGREVLVLLQSPAGRALA